MGLYDSDSSSKCRRHPNEKQHPGVCSCCLREKLSKINTTPSSSFTKYRIASVSSSVSATPPAGNRHRRNGSDVSAAVVGLNLKKSKSVSCAPNLSRSRGGSHHHGGDSNKIGRMFGGGDSNSGSSRKEFEMGMGGIEETTGEIRRKKGWFLKRFIHSTTSKK